MKIVNNQNEYLKQRNHEKRKILIIQLFLIFLFITLWQVLADYKIIDSFIYSSPLKICKQILSLAKNHNLWIHIFATLKEVVIAFSVGILLGLLIAIIFYLYPPIAKIFDPFLTTLNSLPKVALGPIIIIIFGAKEKSIIIMATLINVIVNIVTIYSGFKKVDAIKIKMLKSFNASKYQILTNLVLPNALDDIISSLKLNTSLTLIGVITGEFLVSKAGIGYLIIYGTQVFNLDLVMSGIFLLLIISILIYFIVIKIQNKLLHK